jgi:hypothetical protein
MMGKPTKFNNIESGATSSQPTVLSAEEINRLVNKRSLRGADSAELVNERPHPTEEEPTTVELPLPA